MLLGAVMNQNISLPQELAFFLRILCAGVCGILIGMERSKKMKDAGVRTHLLISCTAAMMMIVSKYGFADLPATDTGVDYLGTRGADAARIAAQVVSAISFLGAGVIFKNGGSVRGLTTAAGMWATAGVGLAFGCGLYLVGAFSTALVIVTQKITHIFAIGNDALRTHYLEMTVDGVDYPPEIHRQFEQWGAQVINTRMIKNPNGTTTYKLYIKTDSTVSHEEIKKFVNANKCLTSFSEDVSSY